jgi:CBS domain-containing protein
MPASVSGLDLVPVRLNTVLRRLQLRPAVRVAPNLSVRDSLRAIDADGAELAVIVDPRSSMPLGIATLRNALRAILDGGLDLGESVGGVMTGGVAALSPEATVHEAMVHMFRSRVDHLLLNEDDGTFYNIVSQGDLYGMQAVDSQHLANAILAAGSVDALAGKAAAVRSYAAHRLTDGASAESLCEWISALNDLVTLQVIDLVEGQFELPYVPWCWLVFGSEGRLEQTLITDQDNGIVFAADSADEAEALRRAFLPFAEAVNRALDHCGFSLCTGNIMAGNPAWCLSLDEWKARFAHWIEAPEPGARLNATIFFDFRPLYGRYELAGSLRDWLLGRVSGAFLFHAAMAVEALQHEPPLGWLRRFRFEDAGHPGTINLKTRGVRLFVDAERIFALMHGCGATSTTQRLRDASGPVGIPDEELGAVIDAFYQIQRLRLRQQLATGDIDLASRVHPAQLHELDRQILKEAFAVAGRLQHRLKSVCGQP